jgi:hypothetical protein
MSRRPHPPSAATLRRWWTIAAPLLQGTAAATIAWVIAKRVAGHPDPFFAPLAAFISLNAPLGERGRNALRLLLGVLIGIVAGELAIALMGNTVVSLALATFTALLVARALGGARLVLAQSAAGAILTVASANSEVGINRAVDALIGGAVALVFSQFLFSPEPIAMLRRAERGALTDLAAALRLTARALEGDDRELDERAVLTLRGLRDRMVELARVMRVSVPIARHSVVWRGRMAPVAREREGTHHLDLLGGSCLMLVRTTLVARPAARRMLTPSVRELADILAALAGGLDDHATLQRAADRALAVARGLGGHDVPADVPLAAAIVAVRMVVTDLMAFTGVDPAQAAAAVRDVTTTGTFRVPAPTPAARLPFDARRLLARRKRRPRTRPGRRRAAPP